VQSGPAQAVVIRHSDDGDAASLEIVRNANNEGAYLASRFPSPTRTAVALKELIYQASPRKRQPSNLAGWPTI
jgi:hypothetical protein